MGCSSFSSIEAALKADRPDGDGYRTCCGIPQGFYAAGQHLNPYSLNQRGFYGTAAALLAMRRSRPSPNRIGIIEGLIKYINDRPALEQGLADTEEDQAMLPARLILDWKVAFKCADLLYALAATPPAVAGRETLLQDVLGRLHAGHRKAGGWAVDLAPGRDRDPLATACVIRSLHAAGVNVEPSDLDLVRSDAMTVGSASPYVRCLSLLVLLEAGGGDDNTTKIWDDLLDTLRSELHDRTEANYEFTIGNRQYYVRVPWQLYLIASASICKPTSLIFTSDVRRALLDCVQGSIPWRATSESSSRLNAVGPELAAAVLLGVISLLLGRVRTRKK
jgi:hypothetical protein